MRPVFWFVGLLITASLLLASIHLSANTLDFSRYNLGWNGTSRFFSDLDRNRVIDVTGLSALESSRGTLLLIIAPGRPYRPDEIAAYRRYLEDGNTIFLADDFGTGNGLLRGVGSSIVIIGSPLLSFDREYDDPGMVVVTRVKNSTVPGDPSRMVLNEPASVEGGEPLMTSSFMSWIDQNGNGKIDSSEPLGRHRVLARDRVGRGELIVFADPGIFINAMYFPESGWDNRKFISSLVTNTSPVLIDQINSRTADDEGVSLALHSAEKDPAANFGIIAAGVLVLIVAWVRRML
ncbi:MAG: DUF4350 domain-containing protein [Methanomicrobiales archaeon]|jgi:hypothetical protein